MALQQQKAFNIYGKELVFEKAYVQILKVNGNKNEVTMDVAIYSDISKEHVLEYRIFNFIPSQDESAERWDKQGYLYLKTIDEFSNALDI